MAETIPEAVAEVSESARQDVLPLVVTRQQEGEYFRIKVQLHSASGEACSRSEDKALAYALQHLAQKILQS